jgi:hypothetical protein
MKNARRELAASLVLVCTLFAGSSLPNFAASSDPLGVNDVGNAVTTGGARSNSAGSSAAAGSNQHEYGNGDVVRTSRTAAVQLARDVWFDKIAAANPSIVATVCNDPKAATVLAAHPHLGKVADADHLLCRRLTRWHTATEVLLRNPQLDRVVELDPQGMYWAMDRRPAYARVLSGHVLFYKMVSDNPELGSVVASHMR